MLGWCMGFKQTSIHGCCWNRCELMTGQYWPILSGARYGPFNAPLCIPLILPLRCCEELIGDFLHVFGCSCGSLKSLVILLPK
jgi:hypothetical protein